MGSLAHAEEELRDLVATSYVARFATSAVVIRQGGYKSDFFCVVEAGALDFLAAAVGADGPPAALRAGSRSAPRSWPAPPSASRPSCTATPARPPSIVAAHTRRREVIVQGVLWGVRTSLGRRPSCPRTSAGPRASPPPPPSTSSGGSATRKTCSTDRIAARQPHSNITAPATATPRSKTTAGMAPRTRWSREPRGRPDPSRRRLLQGRACHGERLGRAPAPTPTPQCRHKRTPSSASPSGAL